MPTGMYRRRLPLPPTPGTVVVQPIGEATSEEIAAYAAGREREREIPYPDHVCDEWCQVCEERPGA